MEGGVISPKTWTLRVGERARKGHCVLDATVDLLIVFGATTPTDDSLPFAGSRLSPPLVTAVLHPTGCAG